MIFGIEILNIAIWLLLGVLIGGILPIFASFLAPAFQLSTDISAHKNIYTRSGLFSVFDKYFKTVAYALSGSIIGPVLYRIISGNSYVNYSTDGYFYCIVGTIWMLLAYKFAISEGKK